MLPHLSSNPLLTVTVSDQHLNYVLIPACRFSSRMEASWLGPQAAVLYTCLRLRSKEFGYVVWRLWVLAVKMP